MIGRIRGKLLVKQPPELLLETDNGVSYEITAPMTTFYQLPPVGEEAVLYTHLVVRDDAHSLFGFFDLNERALFRALIKVNGVGPRLGLAILSSIEPRVFADCLQHHDTAALVKIPGIGKKTAERLVIEMRDNMDSWTNHLVLPLNAANKSAKKSDRAIPKRNLLQEAMDALIALGYRPADASRLLNKVYQEDLSCETLIRLALREVAA
ncbi:MAG: holliday junction helicase RuvA [Gammaproteobacteria bacterium]|jgi:Holliday junction DNA helicase RuvA|nr:holliday junction helicase RuvA [Gammaproteobacteria bacterium]